MSSLYSADAELYDIAFDWDVEEEVDWLLGLLGTGCRTVLEPGCGSGRMLEAFVRRGVEAVGIDRSPEMLALARRRLADGGEVVLADMTDFELGRTFDSAICPINTLLYLRPDDLQRHLGCVARHLERGGRYDAGRKGSRPSVPAGTTGGLLWHELVRER